MFSIHPLAACSAAAHDKDVSFVHPFNQN